MVAWPRGATVLGEREPRPHRCTRGLGLGPGTALEALRLILRPVAGNSSARDPRGRGFRGRHRLMQADPKASTNGHVPSVEQRGPHAL